VYFEGSLINSGSRRLGARLTLCVLLVPGLLLAQESHEFEFAEIDGNAIAWSCEGSGRPTVALIAGGGLSAHDSFGRIYHAWDGPGRICMYDRAGIGTSTFAQPKVRTLDDLVEELHALAAGQDWGDLVLVAHSFGGFIGRAYADKYPDSVSALLLLDIAHEDWLPRLEQQMSSDDWAIMQRILDWNTRTFHEDFHQAQEAVRNTSLRATLPITVIARGIPHTNIRLEGMSYAGLDVYENEHRALQPTLVGLSANAEYRVARYSSHIFNDWDPWLVIDEIKALIDRL